MKHLRIFEEFENENLDLQTSVREHLINEYPGDWWNNEFSNRVYDYVDEDEYVGDGDPDDESTWEYSGPEEAYQNLCNGGAVEYDLIEDIRKDICEKFHLTNDEYFKKGIDDIVVDHMCNVCDWWDHMIFGISKDKGRNPFDNQLDTSNLPKLDNDIEL
jgi:hypothetical protein